MTAGQAPAAGSRGASIPCLCYLAGAAGTPWLVGAHSRICLSHHVASSSLTSCLPPMRTGVIILNPPGKSPHVNFITHTKPLYHIHGSWGLGSGHLWGPLFFQPGPSNLLSPTTPVDLRLLVISWVHSWSQQSPDSELPVWPRE